MDYELRAEDQTFWETNRYLVLSNLLDPVERENLQPWVEEIASWPERAGQWMKYFEQTRDANRQLCRVENFLEHHAGLRELMVGPGTLALLGKLMGEEAILFKEKINYKLAGGAGFTAHQDAPAFASFGQRYHITMLVAVDAMNPANGCMEFSDPVPTYETLNQKEDGTLTIEEEEGREWRSLELAAGDVVFFDSYLPHRSQANRSRKPRRALYITYNRSAEGDRRLDYYAHKRQLFPPECEREAGIDYAAQAGPYNLGNPIR